MRRRWLVVLVLVLVFVGITAGVVVDVIDKVTTFAQAENAEKTALVQNRLDETFALLSSLSEEPYIRSADVTFLDKAQYLTDLNQNEQLGYMMIRILDGDINVYREGVGVSSNLASRDYLQALYSTGETQVTDAFLAGADGTTINYTVAVAIDHKDGWATGALFAAIYGTQIDEYLMDDQSVNVLVGSQLQYMGGIPREQFGMAVSQVLGSELETSRPVEDILQDFYDERSGSFWGVDKSGIQYFIYSSINNCIWTVLTEVNIIEVSANILILYGCAVLVLLAVGYVLLKRKRTEA